MKKEILRMSNIVYKEKNIEKVHGCSIYLLEGEIIGILGENYSGKNDFIGSITGEKKCDSGSVSICERKKKIDNIENARREGIFHIKLESSLIEEFSVKDIMKLNYAFMKKKITYKDYCKLWNQTLELFHITVESDNIIENLSFHQRIMLEIVQSVVCEVKILILESLLGAFSLQASKQMLNVCEILKNMGIGVIIIENSPQYLEEFVDRLYVMRKGNIVAQLDKEEWNQKIILSLMEGQLVYSNTKGTKQIKDVISQDKLMEFRRIITKNEVIKDLNFDIYKGEVLGLYNRNRHSGEALEELLNGKTDIKSGDILYRGFSVLKKGKIDHSKVKLQILTEKDQYFTNMNFKENIEMGAIRNNSIFGIIKKDHELRYLVSEIMGEYISDEQMMFGLEQVVPDHILIQKEIMLCRAILTNPQIIIHSSPFLKMDMREEQKYSVDILKTQKKDITQIIISSQLELLYPICNRILQFQNGKIISNI